MTPKISKKNQLFHVQYLSNSLTTGNLKRAKTSASMSNFLQLQSFHICKQTVHKKKKYNHSSMIINDVLSPNYICTYQEKEIILLSTSASVQYS